ncbi:MAG: hypothetical protein GY857_06215 [Desulfobacula sp.]|nr:hypothetical protein [Desulfobacula sp.]
MKKVFFYLFRIKENAGNIFLRVMEWAEVVVEQNPQCHYHQDFHIESDEVHSRSLWRLPGLRYDVYAGIQEGFMIEKTNLESQEKDRQFFISNRPSNEWSAQCVLDRALLHWDTETGVFGIKDNTFQEDKVRYKLIEGATAHVALLNVAWNGLYAPVFDSFWQGEPMSCRIQFLKDYPEYNPFT